MEGGSREYHPRAGVRSYHIGGSDRKPVNLEYDIPLPLNTLYLSHYGFTVHILCPNIPRVDNS